MQYPARISFAFGALFMSALSATAADQTTYLQVICSPETKVFSVRGVTVWDQQGKAPKNFIAIDRDAATIIDPEKPMHAVATADLMASCSIGDADHGYRVDPENSANRRAPGRFDFEVVRTAYMPARPSGAGGGIAGAKFEVRVNGVRLAYGGVKGERYSDLPDISFQGGKLYVCSPPLDRMFSDRELEPVHTACKVGTVRYFFPDLPGRPTVVGP